MGILLRGCFSVSSCSLQTKDWWKRELIYKIKGQTVQIKLLKLFRWIKFESKLDKLSI